MKTVLTYFLLIIIAVMPLLAQTSDAKADQARKDAAKIGTGEKAKVEVKLRDGSKVKGRIVSATADAVTLAEDKTSNSRTSNFADIDKIKKRGGLSTGAKAGLIAGIAGGVLVIVAAVGAHCVRNLGC